MKLKKNRKSQVLVLIIVGVLLVLTLLAYLYFSKEKEQTEINESLIGKENLSGELLPYIINLNNTKLVADIYMDEGSMRFGALLKFKITALNNSNITNATLWLYAKDGNNDRYTEGCNYYNYRVSQSPCTSVCNGLFLNSTGTFYQDMVCQDYNGYFVGNMGGSCSGFETPYDCATATIDGDYYSCPSYASNYNNPVVSANCTCQDNGGGCDDGIDYNTYFNFSKPYFQYQPLVLNNVTLHRLNNQTWDESNLPAFPESVSSFYNQTNVTIDLAEVSNGNFNDYMEINVTKIVQSCVDAGESYCTIAVSASNLMGTNYYWTSNNDNLGLYKGISGAYFGNDYVRYEDRENSLSTGYKPQLWVDYNGTPEDTTPPYFNTSSPYNMEVKNNEYVFQQINATDANSSISCFSINDTTNFKINCSGYFENNTALTVGKYNINVTVNDTEDNKNSTVFYVNVTDGIPPYFTQIPSPYSLEYCTEFPYNYIQFQASDETSFSDYSLNDSRFTIDSNGYLNKVSPFTPVQVGLLKINVTINDSANNKNHTIYNITTTKCSAYFVYLQSSKDWTFDYDGASTNLTTWHEMMMWGGDADVHYSMYKDGVFIANDSFLWGQAGTYSIKTNTTGGENYTAYANLDTRTLTINKISSNVSLYLDNVEDNILINRSSVIDINATRNVGEGELTIYIDGEIINQGTAPLHNATNFSTSGSFNISAYHPTTANYTANWETFWVNTTPMVSLVSPINDSTFTTSNDVNFVYNVSHYNTISACNLTAKSYLMVYNQSVAENMTGVKALWHLENNTKDFFGVYNGTVANSTGDCWFFNEAECNQHPTCTPSWLPCWYWDGYEAGCNSAGGNCSWDAGNSLCVGNYSNQFDTCSGSYYYESLKYVTGKMGNATKPVDSLGGHYYTSLVTNSNNVTLSAWVKLDDAWQRGTIIQQGNSNGIGMCIGDNGACTNTGQYLMMHLPSIAWVGSDNTISAGAWHHIAITNRDGEYMFYIDGANVKNYSGSTSTATGYTNIGAYDTTGSSSLTMSEGISIDEVAIFNRTLTPQDIQDLYDLGYNKLTEYKNSSSSVTREVNQTLFLDLPNDIYYWDMKCTDSNGIQSSSPIYTLNVSSAEGCTPEYANTTWTEWINLTCASNQMNQSRNKTQYDINDCGYENETFFEYQLVNDWQNTSWTDWYNVSSCYANNTILQERNLTNYDSYGCGENFSSFEWQEGVCTYPTPLINFTFPTPNNNTGALMVNMTINVSSNESLREVFVNFNKTLSLWMKLNNETGENATFVKDYSGYGNNGTILDSSNTEFNNSGYFGAGLSFNGNTNKYVNVTDSDSLDLNGNFTISIWVKQNSISPLNQGLLRKKTNISGSTGYWIGMNDGYPLGTPYFILEEPNHRAISKWNGVNISDGNWHNLIVVYNAGKNFTFYNNGVLTNTYSSVLPTDASNSLSLRIGQGTSVFNGTIDEIIIMKRAMSSSEILSLYNATANKYINEFRLLTGNYSYIAYGQMTNGTVESTEERTIYTNNLYPYFTTAPSNANYYVGVNISEQFTAEDFSGIANYSVNDSRFNISSNGTLTNNQIIIAGTTLLNITATNNIGNSNYTILSLLISDRDYPPIIEVSSPYQREVKTNPLVNVTLSIDEPLLDTCWYQVDSTNTTFPCSSVLTINYFNFTHNFTSIGEKVLTIFANNTIGLQGNKEIHFKVLDNICYKNVTINGVHVYYDDCNTTLQNKLIYNFTGTSSWINMSNYEYLSPPSNDWYVSFWMNPSVIEAGTKYVFRKLNTTAGYGFYNTGNQTIGNVYVNNTLSSPGGDANLTGDNWSFYTLSKSGGKIKIYKDGFIVPTSSAGSLDFNDALSSSLYVGGSGASSNFKGDLANFKIYDGNITNANQLAYYYEQVYNGTNNPVNIPVLMYHSIGLTSNQITLEEFTNHMAYFNASGYTTVTPSEYIDWRNGLFSMPTKPLIISFDDATTGSWISFAQVMSNYGYKAVMFLQTGACSSNCWTNVSTLANTYNWEVGSHTVTHCYMGSYSGSAVPCNTTAERTYEFNQSYWDIYNNLGTAPVSFSFPYTSYNDEARAECLNYYNACYSGSSNTDNPRYNTNETEISNLFRVVMFNSTTTANFETGLNFYNKNYIRNVNILDLRKHNDTSVFDLSVNQFNGTFSNTLFRDDGSNGIILINFNSVPNTNINLSNLTGARILVNNVTDLYPSGVSGNVSLDLDEGDGLYIYNNWFEESCTPSYQNTSWTSWIDLACVSNQMNQSRNKTSYDENNCGYVNETFFEYQLTGPLWQNTSWSDWYDITGCRANATTLQERNLTQYDNQGCASNITVSEYQENFCLGDPPVVTLISPANNSYFNISQVGGFILMNFTFNVTSNKSISRCLLYINHAEILTNTTITTNIPQIISYNISSGRRLWSIKCFDSAGLSDMPIERFLTALEPLTILSPLNLERIFVLDVAGTPEIFTFLAILILAFVMSRFGLSNKIALALFALFGVIMAIYLSGLYTLIILVVGLVTFYGLSKLAR